MMSSLYVLFICIYSMFKCTTPPFLVHGVTDVTFLCVLVLVLLPIFLTAFNFS